MPAFTPTEWGILFLVFLLGWLLGLLSRSGGRKWRRLYESERDARAEEQRELTAAHARIAELEAAVPAAAPVVTRTAPVATPATLDLTRDDLTRITGITTAGERRLNGEGIYRYADLANLTPEGEAALEQRLGADPGYIEQERWREQAALLADGKLDEHRSRFG
jgi:predicted flap endonuclease-1-like 5' DNA nuclease